MGLYFSIYAVLVMIAANMANRRISNGVAAMLLLFFGFFMGTRFFVGCDFVAYWLRYIRYYDNVPLSDMLIREEPGFHVMNWVLKSMGLGYMWLNIVASTIYMLCVLRFAKLSPSPMMMIALFFPILIVQLGMSGLRQALATGFLMLALTAFTERSRFKTGMWIMVGSLFHTSTLIFLPVALIARSKVSVWRILFAAIVLGPVAASLLGDRAEVYSDRYVQQIYGEISSSGAIFRYALALLPYFPFVLHHRQIKTRYPQIYELIRLFTIITFGLAPLLVISTVGLHRMVYFVFPVSILTLVTVVDVMYGKNDKAMKTLVPFVIYGSYIVVWFAFSKHANECYVPYQSFQFR